jgi:hypothetical protein
MDIEKLMNDSDFCEKLGDVIRYAVLSDDASSRLVGMYALRAYKDNDADDVFIAICGWTMDTLIKMARKQIESSEEC